MFRVEHNVETGEITQIELTPAEIAEIKNNAAKAQSDETTKVAQKDALLKKLGITADEAALLLG